METPPPSFFEALDKYYLNALEDAKKSLGSADDIYSKALMILVDVKLDNGEHDKEIQERIDAMDFKGNDIALMFCVLAQEYSLHMTGAKNLILKRFDKPITVIKGDDSESDSASEPDSSPEAASSPASAPAPAPAPEEGESKTKPPTNNAKNANNPSSPDPEASEPASSPDPEATNANNPSSPAAPEATNANKPTPDPEANMKPAPEANKPVPKANKVNTSTPTKPQVGGKRKTRRAKPSPSSEKQKEKKKEKKKKMT